MRADEGAVSRRYARSAMLYLEKRGGHEEFGQGLGRFVEAFSGVPLLRALLTSPVVSPQRKEEYVRGVARLSGLSEAAVRFLLLLVKKGRIEYVEGIASRFSDLLDEKMKRVRAAVRSPMPLGPIEKQAVTAALARHQGKQVLASFDVDESLLGGVVARVGNTIMDSSIKGKLSRLRKKIESLSA